MVLILFGATLSWGEEYKSMCELYPEQCAENDMAKLGEIGVTEKGYKYRIIEEAKLTNKTEWFQFVDVCRAKEELDGKCDTVVFFTLKSDGLYGKGYSCAAAALILALKCKKEGIKYEDYVHKAK